jgi:UDPglucose 6-dehydrogenase
MTNNSIKLSVYGCGFVGQAIIRGFNLYADVKAYDIDPKRCVNTFEETIMCDFVFLCLPTPMVSVEGGECNLSIIYDCFEKINSFHKEHPELSREINPIYIIKSTVPIGTTRKLTEKYINLNIIHSPEFLTARCANLDFVVPARNIVGGNNLQSVNKLANLYKERFPGVLCLTMSSDESEAVKYAANCFFATKVMFFNEMKLISDKLKLNWNNIIEGVMSDGRIAKSHYQVPGHDGDAGFGGLCFSKDINALIATFCENGLDPKVLKAVWEQNKKVRKNWDWATSKSAVMEKK